MSEETKVVETNALELRDIINLQTGLQKLSTVSEEKEYQKKFPVKIQFRTARIIKSIQPLLEDYNESRTKQLKIYGKEVFTTDVNNVDSEGNPIRKSTGNYDFDSTENREAFNEAIDKILSETPDFSSTYKFSISELVPIIKPLGINALVSLMPIIDFDLSDEEVENLLKAAETPETKPEKKK